MARAAKLLGTSRRTLYRRLHALGLKPDSLRCRTLAARQA
jgi:DNA-binding NtrC family response regulator